MVHPDCWTRAKKMKLSKLITEALQKHSKVLVFTHNEEEVKKLFLDEPGRWTIIGNENLWNRKGFDNEKVTTGQASEGFKVGLSWERNGDNPGFIGTGNSQTQIIVSKQLSFHPSARGQYYIIKDWTPLPQIKIETHYPPLLAIQKEKTPLLIFCESKQHYYDLHDQFVMQEIDHSIQTSGEFKSIHLIYEPRYIEKYPKVLIYGYKPLSALFPFHASDLLILVRPQDVHAPVKSDSFHTLLRCFAEAPESALSSDYIGLKTFMHPRTIEKMLLFLQRVGCVHKSYQDRSKIVIHKTKTIPNDIEFNLIPEGSFKINELVNYCRIPRASVFNMLKKYEGNGIVFSYSQSRLQTIWTFRKALTLESFQETWANLQQEEFLLKEWENIGEIAINRYLEEQIQTYCVASKRQAMIQGIDQQWNVIDPCGKLIPDPSDSTSEAQGDNAKPALE